MRKAATSFGMKESVASLICVAAWKMLTISPITSVDKSKGPESIRVTSMA